MQGKRTSPLPGQRSVLRWKLNVKTQCFIMQWMTFFMTHLLYGAAERLCSNMRFLEVRTCNSLSLSLSLQPAAILCNTSDPQFPLGIRLRLKGENENGQDTVECETQVCVCVAGMWMSEAHGVRNEAVSHSDCRCARPLRLCWGPSPPPSPSHLQTRRHRCFFSSIDKPPPVCAAAPVKSADNNTVSVHVWLAGRVFTLCYNFN